MNRAKYTEKNSFPLSTEGLDFIQQQILLAAEYARAAGGNYILSGCKLEGNTVSAGTLVINGEIIPFRGGTRQTTIRIASTVKSLTAGSETYGDAYTERYAEFGGNVNGTDTFNWSSFNPFPTNKFLLTNSATKEELKELRMLTMPKGAIIMWSGDIRDIPRGFALCDNSNGTPDLRGRFIVGYDPDKPNTSPIPNDLTENYGKIGNTGGQLAVTLTKDQMPSHNHINKSSVAAGEHGLIRRTTSGGTTVGTVDSIGSGNEPDAVTPPVIIPYEGSNKSHENRPPYFVLAFIMKIE